MNLEKPLFRDVHVVITSAIMSAWLISHYFNGMMLSLLYCWFIILPVLLVHIVSFFYSINIAFVNFKMAKFKLLCHGFVLLLTLGIMIQESDLFKSERILTATKDDDHYFETLTLRKDGTAEMYGSGLAGNTDTYYGNYRIKDDLIIFTKKPVKKDRSFPDAMYWDKKKNMLFVEKDIEGNFITEPGFLNHFQIR